MVDGDSNVVPEYSHRTGSVDRHGTSCAGVIAMARDNDYCGVGVAYNARLVGKLSLSFLFYSLDLSLLSPSLSLSPLTCRCPSPLLSGPDGCNGGHCLGAFLAGNRYLQQ